MLYSYFKQRKTRFANIKDIFDLNKKSNEQMNARCFFCAKALNASFLFFGKVACNAFLRGRKGFFAFFPVGRTNLAIFFGKLQSVD